MRLHVVAWDQGAVRQTFPTVIMLHETEVTLPKVMSRETQQIDVFIWDWGLKMWPNVTNCDKCDGDPRDTLTQSVTLCQTTRWPQTQFAQDIESHLVNIIHFFHVTCNRGHTRHSVLQKTLLNGLLVFTVVKLRFILFLFGPKISYELVPKLTISDKNWAKRVQKWFKNG